MNDKTLQRIMALAVFALAFRSGGAAHARTLAFSTLVFSELARAFASRMPTLSIKATARPAAARM